MLKAYLHPKKKQNYRHWYAYDVVFDRSVKITLCSEIALSMATPP